MDRVKIIQGGMGIGVSSWQLARAVSLQGEMGVVSGTGIATVFVRKLQDGDVTGEIRRALRAFPDQAVAEQIYHMYYLEPGERGAKPYKRHPMFSIHSSPSLLQLMVLACFTEVFLAKEGHGGLVGINFLEKLMLGNLPGLYGAILAGVDCVLMGAGIPREIPGALDALTRHEMAAVKMPVEGSEESHLLSFDPKRVMKVFPEVQRPKFFPIVSSVTLASHLLKKSNGSVEGFIVELPAAGGHNAPPRGGMSELSESGEPIYTSKDEVDCAQMRKLGVPFWLAGEFATPEKLQAALEAGAQGVQVGTAFAFAEESGLRSDLKSSVLSRLVDGKEVQVKTDPFASPSGYPFKVVGVEGTMSEEGVYEERERKCDLGYLRTAYMTPKGQIGYRCPSEPVADYLRKGGDIEDTKGRKCLCNGLTATIGFAQDQESGYTEQPLVTAGNDLEGVTRYLAKGATSYTAADVIQHIRGVRP